MSAETKMNLLWDATDALRQALQHGMFPFDVHGLLTKTHSRLKKIHEPADESIKRWRHLRGTASRNFDAPEGAHWNLQLSDADIDSLTSILDRLEALEIENAHWREVYGPFIEQLPPATPADATTDTPATPMTRE